MFFIWCESKEYFGWVDNKLKDVTQKIVSAKRFNTRHAAKKAVTKINNLDNKVCFRVVELSTIEFLKKLEESGFEFRNVTNKEVSLEIETKSFSLIVNELKELSNHRNVLRISNIHSDSSTKTYKVKVTYKI